jgi:nucleoid-associated protein YgaU
MDRYRNIPIIKSSTGTRYYRDSKYPRVSLSSNDIYVITTVGDRLDLLSRQYYNDPTLWWVISIANEDLPQDSLFIPVGTQLRIPANINDILSNYDTLNSE